MAASDETLIGGDLRSTVTAIALSRKTVVVIKQGLFWAFAYNVLLIPVAMGMAMSSPSLSSLRMPISPSGFNTRVISNALNAFPTHRRRRRFTT